MSSNRNNKLNFNKDNSEKSKNGNILNEYMTEKLNVLQQNKLIKNLQKEKSYNQVGGFKDENIRVDQYFESFIKLKVNGNLINVRFIIDNFTTVRNDRFRSKNDEARKSKKNNLCDIFLAPTSNLINYNTYDNPNTEKRYVIRFNNYIINNTIDTDIDMLLPIDLMIDFITELCDKKNDGKDLNELLESLKNKQKYKLNQI